MMIDGNRACSAPDAGFGYPDDPPHVQSLIVTPGGNAIVFVPEATHLEHCGNDRIDLRYFGRGHTNGDAWVVFPALRVMHAGDIFARKAIPLLDYNNGGSGVELPDSLAKAYDAVGKNMDYIITGHGPVMTPNDLREFAEFNRDFLNAVREGKRAGRSAEEIAKSWTIPEKYKGYAPPQPARLQINVENIYKETR